MKKIFFVLFSFILFTSSMIVLPDQSEEAAAHIQTIYIYNFTKYIEWPDTYKQGNFVVGILGNSNSLNGELGRMASSKTVGVQKIEIKNFASAAEISQCHIVYINSDNSSQLADVVSKIKNKSTLIVTDKPGLAKQGSGINFVVVDSKQKFEINQTNIEKYNLKIATNLINMAIQVK